jgi:hypothetical protein
MCLNFDCVSYDCVYFILRQYGLDYDAVALLKGLYAHTSSCQIYGQMSAAFRLKSLVTQICPLSILMYILFLNALLTNFDEALSSFRLNTEVVVIVYENDWNITLTDPTDFHLLHKILYTH